MPTLAERLSAAADRLADVSETPRLDAEILLAHILNCGRAQLLAKLKESPDVHGFDDLLERRLNYEPLAYILGEWEFFGLTFAVEPPMLVPRPETEHLVEVALERIQGRAASVLDVGTGTGCVAVAIAVNAVKSLVTATDINPAALALAERNAARHKVLRRMTFRQGNLFAALEPDDGPFDVICSNPPYVEDDAWDDLSPVIRLHEDPRALLGGADGLDVVRRLISEARLFLKEDGWLAFEIGMGQYEVVRDLLSRSGYADVGYRSDLAGIERIAFGRKLGE